MTRKRAFCFHSLLKTIQEKALFAKLCCYFSDIETMTRLGTHNVPDLPWPAKILDLKPIEILSRVLPRWVYAVWGQLKSNAASKR